MKRAQMSSSADEKRVFKAYQTFVSENANDLSTMNPAEEFVCIALTNLDVSNMTLEKNKKIFDIRKDGKRLWIKCDRVSIKYPYTPNQYRCTEAGKEGTFVVNVDEDLSAMVRMIDATVLSKFEDLYKGTVLNNVAMTENAIRTMFRPSLYSDTLRISVSANNCGVFRSDGTLIPSPDLSTIIKDDASMGIVIEPAFAWMFNQKIGIHWDVRQIKLSKLVLNFYRRVRPLKDENDVDADGSTASQVPKKNSISELFAKQYAGKKFVLPDSDDDD